MQVYSTFLLCGVSLLSVIVPTSNILSDDCYLLDKYLLFIKIVIKKKIKLK